jgi:serine/threonine-protein kinase
MVFIARTADGKQVLAMRLLGESKTTLLSGTENAADPFFSPDGQWEGYFADGRLKKISVHGGAVVTLCDAPFGRGGSWGQDGSIIAALETTSGLFRIPDIGGTPQLLTKPGDKGERTHRWPQILPGGQAVLFTAHNVVAEFDDANLKVLSLPTGQTKIVQRGGYFGRYLPTGHLVYIHQGTLFGAPFDLEQLEVKGTPVPLVEDVAANINFGGGQFDFSQNGVFVCLTGKVSGVATPVLWLDKAGQKQPLVATPGYYLSPRFSPDGKRLAVAVGGVAKADVWVHDLQRETATKLTFVGEKNLNPVWAPDGKHLAYQSGPQVSIMWIRADGAGEPYLLLESKGIAVPYSFSPDGRWLAFGEMAIGTGFDLWMLPLEMTDPDHPKAGKPELFLGTSATENSPPFSPDGRWIAYQSGESGFSQVYVRPFVIGSSQISSGAGGKWLISNDGGTFPRWSRAGPELLYESSDAHIMVADYVVEGDSFRPSKARRWADTKFLPFRIFSAFDLAPDGKRIALVSRMAEAETKGNLHVTMLVNWFDEVRRRLPAGSK